MNWLVAALALCAIVSGVHCATEAVDWCYHLSTCNDATWPTIAAQFCNGSRQSPINIVTSSAEIDNSLTDFTFTGFDNTTKLSLIENTGKTVKVKVKSGVSVSGGALSTSYDTLQFHLHWGNRTSIPGSEHTVDGKQYPMELHIVNIKSSHNGDTAAAVADSTGLAALGFFIEVMDGSETGQPASWKTLTSFLPSIKKAGTNVSIDAALSLDDLLVGVNRSSYYRYLGSLTTPSCNEAVVWTVFKDPIRVSKDLIDLFSTTMYIKNSTSILMTNVYRRVQTPLAVTTQRGSSSSSSKTAYSLGLIALSVLLGKS